MCPSFYKTPAPLLCLLVRLTNALLIKTTFAPDEYWQSLEVAHRMVFGYGHLTWEWAAGLRAYLHPTLFAALYWALRVLGWDTAWAVAKVPMLLQACFAAATDVAVYATAKLLFGPGPSRWALACQLLSWFNFYCSVRTYSNCLEALLTSVAVYHWLLCTPVSRVAKGPLASASTGYCQEGAGLAVTGAQDAMAVIAGSGTTIRRHSTARSPSLDHATGGSGPPSELPRAQGSGRPAVEGSRSMQGYHQRCWILLAALSVVVRPPCALFWTALGLHQLATLRGTALRLQLLADAAGIGGCCLVVATMWDRLNYGRWVFVPWEFLCFNLLSGQSAVYGSHPWHWNLSHGFPAVAATLLPLMAAGLALGSARDARLAWLAGLSLAVYSLPAHKELRFLLPALQLAMPYCGVALDWLLRGAQKGTTGSRASSSVSPREVGAGAGATAVAAAAGTAHVRAREDGNYSSRWQLSGRRGPIVVSITLLAAVQVLMALYFSLVQHRGLLEVPHEIRRLWERSPANTSVLFLTQCHATPWYSHIHAPVPIRFLDCSPPGWAPSVAQLNVRGMDWLLLPTAPACPRGPAPHPATGPATRADTACFSQQQLFRRSPEAFMEAVFATNGSPPGLVVAYDVEPGGLGALLQQHGYHVHRRIANCWWQTDDDTPCSVAIWAREA